VAEARYCTSISARSLTSADEAPIIRRTDSCSTTNAFWLVSQYASYDAFGGIRTVFVSPGARWMRLKPASWNAMRNGTE
jgi:hypothetical protein